MMSKLELVIDSTNVSQVAQLILKCRPTDFDEKFKDKASVFLESLSIGWKAYIMTGQSYNAGDSLINIVDHYMIALANISIAVFDMLDREIQAKILKQL
jgi:hypothetical protein